MPSLSGMDMGDRQQLQKHKFQLTIMKPDAPNRPAYQ